VATYVTRKNVVTGEIGKVLRVYPREAQVEVLWMKQNRKGAYPLAELRIFGRK
jgi:hypothetical protein